jgi:hypothetical protein
MLASPNLDVIQTLPYRLYLLLAEKPDNAYTLHRFEPVFADDIGYSLRWLTELICYLTCR